MKQLQSYPWQNVAEKYPVGSRVQGRSVRSITNYGAFVELEPGIEGLVHILRDELDAQRPPSEQDRVDR